MFRNFFFGFFPWSFHWVFEIIAVAHSVVRINWSIWANFSLEMIKNKDNNKCTAHTFFKIDELRYTNSIQSGSIYIGVLREGLFIVLFLMFPSFNWNWNWNWIFLFYKNRILYCSLNNLINEYILNPRILWNSIVLNEKYNDTWIRLISESKWKQFDLKCVSHLSRNWDNFAETANKHTWKLYT